jgi:hypothetical protein
MRKRTIYTLGMIILLLSLRVSLVADSIRGSLAATLTIPGTDSSVESEIKIEELLALSMPDDRRFIRGIEIELTIPAEIQQLRDSFAIYLFRNVSPQPEASRASYRGTRLTFEVLPFRRKVYIHLPFSGSGTASPDTIIVQGGDPSSFPLLLTILPVMKGIPDRIYSIPIRVKAYPILEDKGVADIDVLTPEGDSADVTIRIDGKRAAPGETLLDIGLHNLEITSGSYHPVSQSFTVTQAQITSVTIELIVLSPQVTFQAPEGALLFLDGDPVPLDPGIPQPIEAGEHTVLFNLGDYILSKKFVVEGGKTYEISLFLDILIHED